MLGQDDRLAAGSIGDVTNLFIEVTRRELAHGTNRLSFPEYPYLFARKSTFAPFQLRFNGFAMSIGKPTMGLGSRSAIQAASRWHRSLSELLPQPTFIARPADAGSGLLQRADTNDGGGMIEAEIHLAKRRNC
jgi:hypothetical protein